MRNHESVDVYQVVFGDKIMALFQFYGVRICARRLPIFPLAEHKLGVPLLGLDGGSTDTNCCDGEECCEEGSRE